MALRKRLFCAAKQPLLPCKTYAFATQNNRFCKVKSQLWFFYGIIFTKSEWFYVVEGVEVVAWLRTAAQWLFAHTATSTTVVGACIFASMRWFVLLCWLRLVVLRQFTKGALCSRYHGSWGTSKEQFRCRMPCKGRYGGYRVLSYKMETRAHLPHLIALAWWARCALVFLLRCKKAMCYCLR